MSSRSVATLLKRITVDPKVCGGKPCVRGMRIRVTDVLDLLANGLTTAEVVNELPDLEEADVRASILYASRRVAHSVLVASRFGLMSICLPHFLSGSLPNSTLTVSHSETRA